MLIFTHRTDFSYAFRESFLLTWERLLLFLVLFLLVGCGCNSSLAPNMVQTQTPFPQVVGAPGAANLHDCFVAGGRYRFFKADEITQFAASRNITLKSWADELEKTQPKTPKEVWTAWYVFFHAERDEAACKMYPLWRNLVEAMPKDERDDAAKMLFEPFERQDKKRVRRLDVWLTACETLGVFYCPRYAAHKLKGEGWSREKITTWMKQRIQDALEYEKFPQPLPSPRFFAHFNIESIPATRWHQEYLEYLRWLQSENLRQYKDGLWQHKYHKIEGKTPPKPQEPEKPFDEEVNRLNEDAKKHPENWQKMVFLIQALGIQKSPENRPDLSWIAGSANKYSAPQLLFLAGWFQRLNEPDTAEASYRQAVSKSLSAEEMESFYPKSKRKSSENLGMSGGMGGDFLPYDVTDEHLQAMYRVIVIDGFSSFLKSKNRENEMTTLREERKQLAKKYHIFLRSGWKGGPYYMFVSPDFFDQQPPHSNTR